MNKQEMKMFSFFDISVFLLVIAASLFLILFQNNGKTSDHLLITDKNGQRQITLSEDTDFTIVSGDITLSVVIENGKVYVKESNCPDGICKNTGKISKNGQVIVCAPAGVALRIVSDEEVGLDAVTH